MGDRLGKDVHFYSITIDPKNDTPEVLKAYKERFHAKWTFLTGKKTDIINLRKKLGLYIPRIQDDSNNHNVNMIIGNQKTGIWMKRSPFENPHILADQIGNSLTDWKKTTVKENYTHAPELRNISRGEQIFRTRCVSCHTITGKEEQDALGPDLLDLHTRRDQQWLYDWLKAPDQMLTKKDPIAMAMYEKYNKLAMPNMRLNQKEAEQLLDYIKKESERTNKKITSIQAKNKTLNKREDVVAIMNAWVRETDEKATVNAGYMTLVNISRKEVRIVKIESDAFKTVEVHQMAAVDGMMEMQEIKQLTIPAHGNVTLKPRGKHLMLIKPLKALKTGDHVDITMTFKTGQTQTISLNVRK
jgi:copper(I)-binding protein/cytochrome c2